MINLFSIIRDNKQEVMLLILFILSLVARLNLDGMPLTHPGNLKAADPFYHVAETDLIINTNGWKYYPDYLSFGVEKGVNPQPPLLYTNAAILTLFSNLPSWDSIYFIASLFSALRIIILYLIVFEIFKNKNLALLSASLIVLPIPVHVWLYELYIGFWLQVFAFTYLVASAWIILKYQKNREKNYLIILSLFLVGILLSHPQDLIFLFLPCTFIGLSLLKEKSVKTDKLKKIFSFIALPLIFILFISPWILNIWGTGKYNIDWNSNPFPAEYLNSLPYPSLSLIPIWFGILVLLGLFININNFRKYKELIILLAYYSIFVFILPYFLKDPYYIGRSKSLIIFILAPFFAIGIYFISQWLSKKTNKKIIKQLSLLIVGIIILGVGINEYITLQNNLRNEHIDESKWESIQWIRENIEDKQEILFLEDCGQASCLLTNKRTLYVDTPEFIEKMQVYVKTGEFPESFKFQFAAQTIVEQSKIEKRYLNFEEKYLENIRSNYNSINDFEYVYLRDLNSDLAALNQRIIKSLKEKGYETVYNKGGIIILKKNEQTNV